MPRNDFEKDFKTNYELIFSEKAKEFEEIIPDMQKVSHELKKELFKKFQILLKFEGFVDTPTCKEAILHDYIGDLLLPLLAFVSEKDSISLKLEREKTIANNGKCEFVVMKDKVYKVNQVKNYFF